MRLIERRNVALESQGKLLETLSYQATLNRGYAIVRGPDGKLIRASSVAEKSATLRVSFSDGDVMAAPLDGPAPSTQPASKKKKAPTRGGQGSLF
jgi:exodeoxyribonuclease VII large subunit